MALPVREMSLTEAVNTQRGSSAWYFDENGVFQESPVVNFIPSSEDLSAVSWGTGRLTVESQTLTVRPTGLPEITLTKLQETAETGPHTIFDSVGLNHTGDVTFSAYVARNGSSRRYVSIRATGQSSAGNPGYYAALLDLDTGTVVDTDTSGDSSVFTGASSDVVSVGGGVYRLLVTAVTDDTSDPTVQFVAAVSDSASPSWGASSLPEYTGDTAESVFVGGIQVEKGSAATEYVYTNGSASGRARIDYDPATGNRLGMMAEGASTNFATPSTTTDAVLDTASTVRASLASTANNKTFGTNIPLRGLIPNTDNNTHYFSASETGGTAGGTKTFSFYAIAGGTARLETRLFGISGDRVDAQFILSGAGSTAFTGDVGTPNFESARIRLVGQSDQGDDVYRCEVTGNYPGSTETDWAFFLTNSSGNLNFTGDGSTVSVYVGGIQVEELPAASSYIPTTTAQVTRAAETHELVSLDPWYRASGYSVAVQFRLAFVAATTQGAVYLSDSSGENRAGVNAISSGSGTATLFVETGNATVANINAGAGPAAFVASKIAARIATDDCAASIDGDAAAVDADVPLPSPATKAIVGAGYDGFAAVAVPMYGWVQDFKYTTELWSDAELATESGTTV